MGHQAVQAVQAVHVSLLQSFLNAGVLGVIGLVICAGIAFIPSRITALAARKQADLAELEKAKQQQDRLYERACEERDQYRERAMKAEALADKTRIDLADKQYYCAIIGRPCEHAQAAAQSMDSEQTRQLRVGTLPLPMLPTPLPAAVDPGKPNFDPGDPEP